MAGSGLIIVPQPGELLSVLSGDPAVAEAVRDRASDVMGHAWFHNEMLGSWGSEDEEKKQEEKKKEKKEKAAVEAATESIFGHLSGPALAAAADAVNDFTRSKMKEDGFFKKILPPVAIGNDELDMPASQVNFGIDWASADGAFVGPAVAFAEPAALTKDQTKAVAEFAKAVFPGVGNPFALTGWDEVEESGVDIAFWYYRKTQVIYSIRRVADNFFWDFATKKFSLMPVSPRAGLPRAEELGATGYIYSSKLSGRLDDGEYVVTCRDSEAADVVIGIMALFMKGGGQHQAPPQQGLENTPIEEGLPSPESTFRRAERRVRSVDTDGPE
jgi:hypothetical protein